MYLRNLKKFREQGYDITLHYDAFADMIVIRVKGPDQQTKCQEVKFDELYAESESYAVFRDILDQTIFEMVKSMDRESKGE